jgi:hypothetical protein
MITVWDTLKENILATDIFHLRWTSIGDEGKRQICDHWDYNLINKFYTKLVQQDSNFSQEEISDHELKNLNQDCLSLVDCALKSISWSKYHTTSHKRAHVILIIAAIMSSAFRHEYQGHAMKTCDGMYGSCKWVLLLQELHSLYFVFLKYSCI